MQIRPAVRDDLPAIDALVRAAVRDMDDRGIPQWDEVYPHAADFAADVAQGTLFVARDDGRLVGVVALDEYQDPEYADVDWRFTAGPVLVVHRLCVHPEAQRRGVARRLMDYAEAYARDRGYRAIRLDAFQANPGAVALYDRRGYRRAGSIQLRKGPFWVFERSLAADGDPGRIHSPRRKEPR